MDEIFEEHDLTFDFLKFLFHWPFQDLFMKCVDSLLLDEKTYYLLLHRIVELIEDYVFGESYNYRLLLRDFWVYIPQDYKNFVLNVESGIESLEIEEDLYSDSEDDLLIPKLFSLEEFTQKDKHSFILILKSAKDEHKEGTLELNDIERVCWLIDLAFMKKFALLDLYLENLILNESHRMIFKKKIASFTIEKSVIHKNKFIPQDELANWVTDPEGIDNLKREIFSEVFKIRHVAFLHIFKWLSLDSFTKLFKWFSLTDEEILSWKKNEVFDRSFCAYFLTFKNYQLKKFENFLNWLGHPSDTLVDILTEILEVSFPEIYRKLFLRKGEKCLPRNILHMYSYNKTQLVKFIEDLRAWCAQKYDESPCFYCEEGGPNDDHPVYSVFKCVFHGYSDGISKDTIDTLITSLSEQLTDLLAKHKMK